MSWRPEGDIAHGRLACPGPTSHPMEQCLRTIPERLYWDWQIYFPINIHYTSLSAEWDTFVSSDFQFALAGLLVIWQPNIDHAKDLLHYCILAHIIISLEQLLISHTVSPDACENPRLIYSFRYFKIFIECLEKFRTKTVSDKLKHYRNANNLAVLETFVDWDIKRRQCDS